MSYVSRDPSLWYNMSGVVACYQPVRAPGPQIARYNIAHGGENRYKATDGAAPTWHGATGWTFNESQWLSTGVFPATGNTIIVRYANLTQTNDRTAIGGGNTQHDGHEIRPMWNDDASKKAALTHGYGFVSLTSPGIQNTIALAGGSSYFNGKFHNAGGAATLTSNSYYGIGAKLYNANVNTAFPFIGSILSVAIVARTLSVSEVWYASRQMAYCDVNPDWSVWGVRRRYWYAAQAGGFQAAWARGRNVLLGGQ